MRRATNITYLNIPVSPSRANTNEQRIFLSLSAEQENGEKMQHVQGRGAEVISAETMPLLLAPSLPTLPLQNCHHPAAQSAARERKRRVAGGADRQEVAGGADWVRERQVGGDSERGFDWVSGRRRVAGGAVKRSSPTAHIG